MAFDITSTLRTVESYLSASGYVPSVQIGEPKSPPKSELSAAIFMTSVGIAQLTLNTTIEKHVVTIRLYRNMLSEPQENIELELAKVVQDIASDLLGDFDLGATIRNVDAGGEHGTSLSTTWGYLDVGGTMYRVADINLPLTVDDSATLVA